MDGLWYILLDVCVQTTLFASAQGPGEISEAISDAVTEVADRRLGGPALGSDDLGGVAASGSGSEAVNPVSMYALFNKRGEAFQAVADFGYAGDISTTATAYYATRSGGATLNTTEFSRQVAPYCADRWPVCNPDDRYRTADGSCNNFNNPLWGASITNQGRFLSPTYGDQSRNQINRFTSFLDLSVTYGSTLAGQNDLREFGTGRLQECINRLLPTGPQGSEC